MLKSNFAAIAQNISANGNYCALTVGLPSGVSGAGIYDNSLDVIDSVYYVIQTGVGVSAGAVSIGLLTLSPAGSPVWVTATTPNSATGAAFTLIATLGASTVYNGSLNVSGAIFVPTLGVRLQVTGLTGGNITLAQLVATKR